MRALVPILLAVCELAVARAEEAHPVRVADHPELRALLASHIRFVPKPKIPAAPAPVWSTHVAMAQMPPPAAAGPDVVRMAPVFVSGDPVFRQLHAALQIQAAQARVRQSYRRLGIGVHTLNLRVGALYVVTVFDIPISVGIAW